jgi:hypothetical protein
LTPIAKGAGKEKRKMVAKKKRKKAKYHSTGVISEAEQV